MSQFSFYISPENKNQPVSLNEFNKPQGSDGFLWVNFDPKDEVSLKLIIDMFKMTPALKEVLLNNSHRPRIELFDECTFISLRGVNFSENDSPEDMINLRVLIYKDTILTLHTRDMISVTLLKESVEKQKEFLTIASFLIALIGFLNIRISKEIEQLDDLITQLEEFSLAGPIEKHQDQLSETRRSLIGFQKHLIPQENVLQELWKIDTFWIKKSDRTQLKNQAEKNSTLVGELEHLRQRAVVLQEEVKSSLSENINRSMYRLSIVATIMLPLSLFAGLMGANVGGMPYANSPYGFVIICLMSLGLAIFFFGLLKIFKWL